MGQVGNPAIDANGMVGNMLILSMKHLDTAVY